MAGDINININVIRGGAPGSDFSGINHNSAQSQSAVLDALIAAIKDNKSPDKVEARRDLESEVDRPVNRSQESFDRRLSIAEGKYQSASSRFGEVPSQAAVELKTAAEALFKTADATGKLSAHSLETQKAFARFNTSLNDFTKGFRSGGSSGSGSSEPSASGFVNNLIRQGIIARTGVVAISGASQGVGDYFSGQYASEASSPANFMMMRTQASNQLLGIPQGVLSAAGGGLLAAGLMSGAWPLAVAGGVAEGASSLLGYFQGRNVTNTTEKQQNAMFSYFSGAGGRDTLDFLRQNNRGYDTGIYNEYEGYSHRYNGGLVRGTTLADSIGTYGKNLGIDVSGLGRISAFLDTKFGSGYSTRAFNSELGFGGGPDALMSDFSIRNQLASYTTMNGGQIDSFLKNTVQFGSAYQQAATGVATDSVVQKAGIAMMLKTMAPGVNVDAFLNADPHAIKKAMKDLEHTPAVLGDKNIGTLGEVMAQSLLGTSTEQAYMAGHSKVGNQVVNADKASIVIKGQVVIQGMTKDPLANNPFANRSQLSHGAK